MNWFWIFLLVDHARNVAAITNTLTHSLHSLSPPSPLLILSRSRSPLLIYIDDDGNNNIVRFCGLKGHEMFCEVERSYIEDGFNLYGLRACVSNFSDCLDLILDRIGPDDSDDSHLTQSACTLYGLIHARYIITAHGLDAMYNKVRC